jgi:PAS domain S-box-containing protein
LASNERLAASHVAWERRLIDRPRARKSRHRLVRWANSPLAAEVCLKSSVVLAAVFFATISSRLPEARQSPAPGFLMPHFLSLIAGPKSSWLDVVTDVIITSAYFVIFGCVFWVLIRLRRIPQIREHRWIFFCFAAFIVVRGAGRLIKVLTDWYPDDSLQALVRLAIAAISVITAACFCFSARSVAVNIRAFVDRFSATRHEKELALLALSASETQTRAVRTQAAQALAETTGRFQLLVEGVRDHALYTVDYDGNTTSWNRGAQNLLGYTESEIIGKPFTTFFTPEDIEKGAAPMLLEKARQSRQSEDEGWRVRKNGERFWAEVCKTAIVEADGTISGFAVSMRDLTAKREAEREIRDTARRMKAIVDSAIDGLITIDEFGTVESFNPACERIFEYSASEVIGQNIKMLMPEPYQSEEDGSLSLYKETGEPRIIGTPGRELTGKRKSGWLFPMDLSVSAFELEGGRYFSGIIRDISERKKIERTLAETSRRFRLLVEGVHDHALYTIDLRGNVTSWNQGAQRLLGYTEPEIIGCNFSCFFSREDLDAGAPELQMQKALLDGQSDDEGWRVRADGTRFWADVKKALLREPSGAVLGFAVVMRDVTERKKITTALDEARKERERMQDGFLSHVSHELRTPLTAIYFFLTNVLDGIFGELNSDQAEQISLALDNATQLKNMVSDLLDITRVQTHKLNVAAQPASPVRLVDEVINTCRTTAAVKRIDLRSELPLDPGEDLPFLWADPARVRQILTNLVENAIKFTPEEGSIILRRHPPLEENGFFCLGVSDTGCGISPENCEMIFDRLAQVRTNSDASRSGLGLGLFITRELVLGHGGRIWLHSVLGEGSTFYFTLPIFSLERWASHILDGPGLPGGFITVLAIDLPAPDGYIKNDLLHEIKRALERCIQPGQDVILPSVQYDDRVASLFIVACTGQTGSSVIKNRISREFHTSAALSTLMPAVTTNSVEIATTLSRGEQLAKITSSIEKSLRDHSAAKARME